MLKVPGWERQEKKTEVDKLDQEWSYMYFSVLNSIGHDKLQMKRERP